MGHMFFIGLSRENINKSWSETPRPRALICSLYQKHAVSNYAPWAKMARTAARMFYTGLHRETLKPLGREP